MFDEKNRFVIKDYQNKPTFSSFLPGIAGELGIPAWCYYNNRGQAVCSFGAQDKDHAIMEFSPAHVAYRDVSRTGFRTFLKVNGVYRELFTEKCDMHIGTSELEIECCSEDLQASAVYFTVPDERTAALARILTIRNTGDHELTVELLDGMSAVVPYGLNQDFLKNMTQLAKAWMQCEDHEEGLAYFRVRASLEDSAVVREVKGGNFCFAADSRGRCPAPVVQPSLIFGRNTSLSRADSFIQKSLSELISEKQITSNQVLCCFFPKILRLSPGESYTLGSLYGQAECKAAAAKLRGKITDFCWFQKKRERAAALVEKLVSPISCKTGDPVFDAYARQTYLDNLLRGGFPMCFRSGEKGSPFHIYSRKHGDPEREYNYFSLGKEYYAQGNGNYRDVNQNRRCDVLFAPETADHNIRTFFDLIQSDGYNPLVILPSTYTLSEEKYSEYIKELPQLAQLLQLPFTPGQLAMAADDAGMDRSRIPEFISRVICDCDSQPNASFSEGYWCDHWTYNLDQIESYLTVFPDKKQELLFTEDTCRWYDTKVLVNPRTKRYCIGENGLRQYYALDETVKQSGNTWMHTASGAEARSSIAEKLLLLCAIKTATLDASGMGVEMEGGRPGWYDALNGLPGLLGSSMAESCELFRILDFTEAVLSEREGSLDLYEEIVGLIRITSEILNTTMDPYVRWDMLNTYKESYRTETANGFRGTKVSVSCAELTAALACMKQAVSDGLNKSLTYKDGLMPTYFTHHAEQYALDANGPIPTALKPAVLPLFLEGPVRYLKLPLSREEKKEVVRKVQQSGLYDKSLRMYKVNESLKGVTYEAGRALAFTPGWLENESVWLHMEYKYLLELLKSGLYTEFSKAFHDAAIPFLDPEVYGRSPMENVSFIASSANPDPSIHGQGFVARLSGSTAEFIHMWQILFFGIKPFRWDGNQLSLGFDPFIPEYLMPKDGILRTTFLGSIGVTYETGDLSALIPGVTEVESYFFTFYDRTEETVFGSRATGAVAEAVRNRSVKHIHIKMHG